MDEGSGRGLLVLVGHHSGSHPDGHFHSRENPISRVTQALCLPVLLLLLCLKYRKTTLLLNLAFLAVTLPLMFKMGSQFMPPLLAGAGPDCAA
jgi:Cu/Ag efflux pump CusA